MSAVNYINQPEMVRPRPRVTPVRLLTQKNCVYTVNELSPLVAKIALTQEVRTCQQYHSFLLGSRDNFCEF